MLDSDCVQPLPISFLHSVTGSSVPHCLSRLESAPLGHFLKPGSSGFLVISTVGACHSLWTMQEHSTTSQSLEVPTNFPSQAGPNPFHLPLPALIHRPHARAHMPEEEHTVLPARLQKKSAQKGPIFS